MNSEQQPGMIHRVGEFFHNGVEKIKQHFGKVAILGSVAVLGALTAETFNTEEVKKVEAGVEVPPCNSAIDNCTPGGTVLVEDPSGSLVEVPTGVSYEPKDLETTTTEPEEETTTTVEHTTTTTQPEDTTTTEPEEETTTTSTTSTTSTTTSTSTPPTTAPAATTTTTQPTVVTVSVAPSTPGHTN